MKIKVPDYNRQNVQNVTTDTYVGNTTKMYTDNQFMKQRNNK